MSDLNDRVRACEDLVLPKYFVVAALLLGLAGCEYWEVDKCLDRGGKWDYEKGECILHPAPDSDVTEG
jgi:hypothetical protein